MSGLTEEELLSLVEGEECILDHLSAPSEDLATRAPCPECSGDCLAQVDPDRPFKPGEPSFNFISKCLECGCEFDPVTRVIRKAGTSPILTADSWE